MGYIQVAVKKIKAVDLEEMLALRKKGHKKIRFRLEAENIKHKKPATASVPLVWLVDCREKYENSKDDSVFTNTFISDWISGWA